MGSTIIQSKGKLNAYREYTSQGGKHGPIVRQKKKRHEDLKFQWSKKISFPPYGAFYFCDLPIPKLEAHISHCPLPIWPTLPCPSPLDLQI